MIAKYIVRSGYIHSVNDGDRHFISARKLMSLYGVDPRLCIIQEWPHELRGVHGKFILLEPQHHAVNYKFEHCPEIEI